MISRNGWVHGPDEMVKPKAITLPNPPLEVIRQYASSKPLQRLVPLREVEIEPAPAPKAGETDDGQAQHEGR